MNSKWTNNLNLIANYTVLKRKRRSKSYDLGSVLDMTPKAQEAKKKKINWKEKFFKLCVKRYH